MAMWLWMAMALVRSVVVLVACNVIATIVVFLLTTVGIMDTAVFEEVRKGLTSLILIGVLVALGVAGA